MSPRAFLIAGDRVEVVANDLNDFRYRAAVYDVPAGAESEAHTNDIAETQFMVDRGLVEFMIGGGASVAFAGDFVRVPPGVAHAYRNVGDTPARLLVRTTSPLPLRRAVRVGFDDAA